MPEAHGKCVRLPVDLGHLHGLRRAFPRHVYGLGLNGPQVQQIPGSVGWCRWWLDCIVVALTRDVDWMLSFFVVAVTCRATYRLFFSWTDTERAQLCVVAGMLMAGPRTASRSCCCCRSCSEVCCCVVQANHCSSFICSWHSLCMQPAN